VSSRRPRSTSTPFFIATARSAGWRRPSDIAARVPPAGDFDAE
jgi:hypothetical protein